MTDERDDAAQFGSHLTEPDDSMTVFKDRLLPVPVIIDQDSWDLLRLAGTLDEKRKHIFLRVLAETANAKLACQSAGYRNMAAINRAIKNDPGFAEAYDEAMAAAGEFVEAEAVRRAMHGTKKAVYYKGDIVGWEIQYSDSLLALLLKAAKPDKYADRSKQEASLNVRIGIAVIPGTVKNAKDWEAQSALVHANQRALNPPKTIEGEFQEVPAGDLLRRS